MKRMLELAQSKDYKDAEARIIVWTNQLGSATREEAKEILLEKDAYFDDMQKSNPVLYRYLRSNDLEISQLAHKIITGLDLHVD